MVDVVGLYVDTTASVFWSLDGHGYRRISAFVYVCLSVCLSISEHKFRNHTSKLRHNFRACCNACYIIPALWISLPHI